MPIALTLAAAAALAYAAAAFGLARRLRAGESANGSLWPLLVAGVGAALQLALHVGAAHLKGAPDLHFFAALSLVSLGMGVLTIAAARLERLEALGVLVFPVAGACVLAYAAGGRPGVSDASPLGWPILMHAWLALLAYAALALAALFALGLWLQEHALRRRRVTGFVRALPPLTQTESLLFRTLVAAFALLTLALAMGLVFVENLFAQHLAHKTVLSLLSWAALATLLFGHWRWGWRGAKAARWTLVAMLLLGLAFFGSRFVYEFLLAR
jgi:ABC-type uncharacterized transport system permease subunit